VQGERETWKVIHYDLETRVQHRSKRRLQSGIAIAFWSWTFIKIGDRRDKGVNGSRTKTGAKQVASVKTLLL